jgi:hypothetical protein
VEINFEEINFADELEKVTEEIDPLYVKHALLHEMIREFFDKGDFESETVTYLMQKKDSINNRLDTLIPVRDYLRNLEQGVPFYVKTRVGRYMARYGLSEEQAKLFLAVHKQHIAAMGTENQKKYSLSAVQNIKWDEEEQTVNVYYDDTWWHYDRRGCWY